MTKSSSSAGFVPAMVTAASPLPASTQAISVRGARQNNLNNVSLDIPKHALTVFTGVSGSGKSSLVFATIAAESQRMMNETYPAFLQGFMPSLDRADVDTLQGVTAAIIVDQERLGANPRSTVGTVTDALALLRIIYAAQAEPRLPSTDAYSFNVPSVQASGEITVKGKTSTRDFNVLGGMCPRCEGLGHVSDLDLTALFDESKSLEEGAITIPGYTADGWAVRLYTESGLFRPNVAIKDFSDEEREVFLYGEPRKVKIGGINMTFEGLVPKLQKSVLSKDPDSLQTHMKAFVDRAARFITCPDCEGTRLAPATRTSLLGGLHIGQVCDLEIDQAIEWLDGVTTAEIAPAAKALRALLSSFIDIGLGYVSLSRSSSSLSGGEAQRVKMLKHLGSALSDVTYIFDEPTTGLHPHDIEKMNQLLLKLRDKGNTVIVVEHKPATIAIADHVIDMGPGAGRAGGEVCFVGTPEQLAQSDTLTGRFFGHTTALNPSPRVPAGTVAITGANSHNLRDVSVEIPLGVLVAVTGVAGSGKSTLIHGHLPREIPSPNFSDGEAVLFIDQTPIRGNRRSSPATYTGLADPIRKAFAKANGVKPGMFSANSSGACPACKGNGVIDTQLSFVETVSTTCHVCAGTGFTDEVLGLTFGGINIHQCMTLPVDAALEFFTAPDSKVPAAAKILKRLHTVGLGYLTIGQSLSTLSGGERQRLKLAAQLSEKPGTIVLDEPTTGLHLADVDNLITMLHGLVEDGHNVIVIEHNLNVIAASDWVIDLGPGGGSAGGQVVATGTPAEVAANPDSVTGQYLAAFAG